MRIWDEIEQLGQQPDPESIALEQRTDGLLGLLAKSAGTPEIPSLLGFVPESERQRSLWLLSLIVKGD